MQRTEGTGFEPGHRVPQTTTSGAIIKQPKKPKKARHSANGGEDARDDAPVVQEDVRFRR